MAEVTFLHDADKLKQAFIETEASVHSLDLGIADMENGGVTHEKRTRDFCRGFPVLFNPDGSRHEGESRISEGAYWSWGGR
jgi:hypothetical protein